MMLDAETKALEEPAAHHEELKLWLRLLTCANLIETQIRSRLRERFDITLPRFDLMAQLDRAPDGMTLSQVSKRMMVSNGNVTHIVDKLLASGDLDRRTAEHDRRVQVITLTPKGRAEFRAMAAEHADWIATLFGGLSETEIGQLMRLLGKAKSSVATASQGMAPPSKPSAEEDRP
ncbi:MarR family winged helix-turn-helix transcriptional regulator [Alsobacter sp. SYSU BS001988]|jgi:DNA-binding MarR family transcriptional regulator